MEEDDEEGSDSQKSEDAAGKLGKTAGAQNSAIYKDANKDFVKDMKYIRCIELSESYTEGVCPVYALYEPDEESTDSQETCMGYYEHGLEFFYVHTVHGNMNRQRDMQRHG